MMSNLFMGRVYYGDVHGMKYCDMRCVRNVIIGPTVLIDASLTHQDYFEINYPGDLSSSKLSCRVCPAGASVGDTKPRSRCCNCS